MGARTKKNERGPLLKAQTKKIQEAANKSGNRWCQSRGHRKLKWGERGVKIRGGTAACEVGKAGKVIGCSEEADSEKECAEEAQTKC